MNFWRKLNKITKKVPLWLIGLFLGISFLAVGFFEGQLTDMYKKAVMICLECIGIG